MATERQRLAVTGPARSAAELGHQAPATDTIRSAPVDRRDRARRPRLVVSDPKPPSPSASNDPQEPTDWPRF
jgi:hypothetical protein